MAISIPWHSNPKWQPTQFERYEAGLGTSLQTARVVTDAGRAYLKAMGPHESPQLLAIEFIATRLAKWLKLPVLDFGIIEIDAKIDEIRLMGDQLAHSGPAFVTRAIEAHTWGGSTEELENLINSHDIGRLIVLDTWLRNCDRYSTGLTGPRANYDNVLLEHLSGEDDGKLRLIAMDHTHCFTCGRELDNKLQHLETIQDPRIFGLFPGFIPMVRQNDVEDAIGDLRTLDHLFVRDVVEQIPAEWQVSSNARTALFELIIRRASYVADNLPGVLASTCWPGKLFDA